MNQVVSETTLPNGARLEIVHGDLTQERVNAIVNAANAHLRHGGGVAGAIVRHGSPEIQRESTAWVREHGTVAHDKPAYTGAGRLPCRYVIHAVGPVWGSGQEDAKLSAAVNGSLALADKLELSAIALPAISTGIFGFPKPRAAGIIFDAIRYYFSQNPTSGLKQVRITIIDTHTLNVFVDTLAANS